MRRVVIAQSASEIERLRPLWESLCAESQGATMFQTFALNELAARMLTSERPFFVAAETHSGAAIIPAAISGDSITLLGDCVLDYRDVLSTGDPEALALAWEALAQLELPFAVRGVRAGAHREIWENLPCDRWCAAPWVPRSKMSAEEFSSAHPRLGSRYRKLERTGVELKHYTGSDSRLVRWIYEQKARQFASADGATNVFANPDRVDFMVAWCAMAGPLCQIFCLESGSEIVSALVTFRDYTGEPARRFYTVYFDLRWEKYSPGTVLVYEVTRQTLAEGLNADYMTGEQPHKLRMATASVPLYSVSASADAIRSLAENVSMQTVA